MGVQLKHVARDNRILTVPVIDQPQGCTASPIKKKKKLVSDLSQIGSACMPTKHWPSCSTLSAQISLDNVSENVFGWDASI